MKYNLILHENGNVMPLMEGKSIEEIVKETSEYYNYYELLDSYGIEPTEDSYVFIQKRTNPNEVLKGGITYQEDLKYFDVDNLMSVFLGRAGKKKFMDAFNSEYYYKLKDVEYFKSVLSLINNELKKDKPNPVSLGNHLVMFVKKYIYEKKDGKYKLKYLNLRNIAMFVSNFLKAEKIEKLENEIIQDDINIDQIKYIMGRENYPEDSAEELELTQKRYELEYDRYLRKEEKAILLTSLHYSRITKIKINNTLDNGFSRKKVKNESTED